MTRVLAARITALEAENKRLRLVRHMLAVDDCELFVGGTDEEPLCVIYSHYAADAEVIPDDEIEACAGYIDKYGSGCLLGWVLFKRGQDRPIKGSLAGNAQALLDDLRRAKAAMEGK